MKKKLPSELTRALIVLRPFKIKKYLSNSDEPKLHLGCGPVYKEGWLNADKFDSRADIYLNGYKKMPFKDNTFKYIYSEHTLEHLKIAKVPFFLGECLRVLQPGGIFRVTVPDLKLLATKYVNNDQAFFAPYLDEYKKYREEGNYKYWLVRSPAGILNTLGTKYFFHHRWFYDYETIRLCAEEIGFRQALHQSYGQSEARILGDMDQKMRKHETVYVDLIK